MVDVDYKKTLREEIQMRMAGGYLPKRISEKMIGWQYSGGR